MYILSERRQLLLERYSIRKIITAEEYAVCLSVAQLILKVLPSTPIIRIKCWTTLIESEFNMQFWGTVSTYPALKNCN